MHETVLTSSRDALLIGIPFLIILLVCFLRLDEIIATSKPPTNTKQHRRAACGVDEDGRTILCDPDGRPWRDGRP
jgi:hypothetical protein